MRELELGQHIAERHAPALEQHEQMIEQVGRLARQGRDRPAERGDDGLDRLLAELLGARLGAAVEQLPRVGLARASRCGAR